MQHCAIQLDDPRPPPRFCGVARPGGCDFSPLVGGRRGCRSVRTLYQDRNTLGSSDTEQSMNQCCEQMVNTDQNKNTKSCAACWRGAASRAACPARKSSGNPQPG